MKSFLVCLAMLISNLATAQDAVDKYIQTQMEKEKIVGLAVGIIKNGEIVKVKGYGKANLEDNLAASENTYIIRLKSGQSFAKYMRDEIFIKHAF
jgi:CubicO group peptidase (beta-lactamase class C family)